MRHVDGTDAHGRGPVELPLVSQKEHVARARWRAIENPEHIGGLLEKWMGSPWYKEETPPKPVEPIHF